MVPVLVEVNFAIIFLSNSCLSISSVFKSQASSLPMFFHICWWVVLFWNLIKFFQKYHCFVAKSCLTLWHPVDCNLPDSYVHGVFQARMLEWVAISLGSKGSSWPRDWTHVSCIGRQILDHWVTWETFIIIILLCLRRSLESTSDFIFVVCRQILNKRLQWPELILNSEKYCFKIQFS